MKNTYSIYHFDFFDKIIVKKRIEILSIIKSLIDFKMISSCLDIGATNDIERKSSNFLIKNLKEIKILKSISIQEMDESFFNTSLNKSIINDFTNIEIEKMSSDLAISSATIEHIGNEKNQMKAIGNIIKLSKKHFVITTPNRFHPIEFHTLIPFIHWLPKKVHRFLLKIIGLNYFSKEENLNLLSKSDLVKMMRSFNDLVDYKIKTINLFGFVSNFIVIGKKK